MSLLFSDSTWVQTDEHAAPSVAGHRATNKAQIADCEAKCHEQFPHIAEGFHISHLKRLQQLSSYRQSMDSIKDKVSNFKDSDGYDLVDNLWTLACPIAY